MSPAEINANNVPDQRAAGLISHYERPLGCEGA